MKIEQMETLFEEWWNESPFWQGKSRKEYYESLFDVATDKDWLKVCLQCAFEAGIYAKEDTHEIQ